MKDSAVHRLRALPAVFTTTSMAQQFGWTPAQVDTALWRWRQHGHVRSFGRTGHHFNLVVDPDSPVRYGNAVMRQLFPSAHLGHLTVLHDEGWTTQIPSETHVYVMRRRSQPRLPGYRLHPRSQRWFTIARGAAEHEQPQRALPALPPAFCLADAIARNDLAGLDPDDFEPDCAAAAASDVAAYYAQLAPRGRALPSEWADWIDEALACSDDTPADTPTV